MLQNQRTPDKNKQKNYGMSAQNFKNLSETIEKTADITKEQLAFLLATEDDAMNSVRGTQVTASMEKMSTSAD